MTEITIRPLIDADVEPVVALWEQTGLTRPWNDPRADIARARAVWPDLLLIADDRGVIGSVMAGYDGHRGWLYYLATDPSRRGEGIGSALVAEAERKLVALGCPKVQLMVRSGNESVMSFYDVRGYERSDTVVTGKRLRADD